MSARTVLKHLYKEGRMTQAQFELINRNLAQRPTGKWIDEGRRNGESWFKCSVCDTSTIVQTTWDNTRFYIPLYKFCPYCGADMRGEEE